MRPADLSPHYDDLLVTAFPLLYRDRHTDPHTSDSLMGWGFCCGDGWFALLWEPSSQLEHGIARLPTEHRTIRAAQVKEKVGELRVYLKWASDTGPVCPHRAGHSGESTYLWATGQAHDTGRMVCLLPPASADLIHMAPAER